MNRLLRTAVLATILATVTGCYHTTINTELTPSSQVIDVPWAPSFVFGLVPPKTVETAEECTNGVAKVETEITFLNGLVGAITLGIFTPMHIKVTCAEGGSASAAEGSAEIEVGAAADTQEKIDAMEKAILLSRETSAPVYIVFSK